MITTAVLMYLIGTGAISPDWMWYFILTVLFDWSMKPEIKVKSVVHNED